VLGKFLEVVGPDDKPLVAALAPKGEKAAEIAASSKRSKTNDKDDN
jgi:hypothetical protein